MPDSTWAKCETGVSIGFFRHRSNRGFSARMSAVLCLLWPSSSKKAPARGVYSIHMQEPTVAVLSILRYNPPPFFQGISAWPDRNLSM